jgi:hypothetical protein
MMPLFLTPIVILSILCNTLYALDNGKEKGTNKWNKCLRRHWMLLRIGKPTLRRKNNPIFSFQEQTPF